jgi:flagellar hook-length control protein FliK
VAALAPSRIATSGAFQKPQTNSGTTANGAPSPFHQLLGTTTDQAGQEQDARDNLASAKNSPAPPSPEKTGGRAQSPSPSQAMAATISGRLIQDVAANNDADEYADQVASEATVAGDGTGRKADVGFESTTGATKPSQNANNAANDSSANQDALDLQPPWNVAHLRLQGAGKAQSSGSGDQDNIGTAEATRSKADVGSETTTGANKPSQTANNAANDSSANQDALDLQPLWNVAQLWLKGAGKTQSAGSGDQDNVATNVAPPSNNGANTSSSQDASSDEPAAPAQPQASAQLAAAKDQAQTSDPSLVGGPSCSTSAPASRKDSQHTKSDVSDGNKQAHSQLSSTDSSSLISAAMAASLPLPTTTLSSPVGADPPQATAITGDGTSKNNQANSSRAPGAKSDQDANPQTVKPNATDGMPSAKAMSAQGVVDASQSSSSQNNGSSQSDSNSQSSSKSQLDSNPQAVASDKQPQPNQPPTSAAPQAQPTISALQSPNQPQVQGAAGTAAVSQHVQVGPQDSGAAANTITALAVAIAARSQSGNKQFDIRLDPPDLGRVEVRLSIDPSGKAQASLSADQPNTLSLLKTDAPMLARALRDAGLNVSQKGLNFSLRGQDRQNGSGSSAPRAGRASRLSLTATSAIGAIPDGVHYQGPANGRLDIRV